MLPGIAAAPRPLVHLFVNIRSKAQLVSISAAVHVNHTGQPALCHPAAAGTVAACLQRQGDGLVQDARVRFNAAKGSSARCRERCCTGSGGAARRQGGGACFPACRQAMRMHEPSHGRCVALVVPQPRLQCCCRPVRPCSGSPTGYKWLHVPPGEVRHTEQHHQQSQQPY